MLLCLLRLTETNASPWRFTCSSCHLWPHSLNLFPSSSICITTLLILHCCWLQWKPNASIPHLCFFTHEWGADDFFIHFCQKNKTKQKNATYLPSDIMYSWWCAWKMLSHLVINFYAVICSMFLWYSFGRCSAFLHLIYIQTKLTRLLLNTAYQPTSNTNIPWAHTDTVCAAEREGNNSSPG